MKIINDEELRAFIAEYSAMFPKTALSYDDIINRLKADYEENGGNTGLFGFEVSPEWENKCYSFEFRGSDPEPTYEFMGMFKC